MNKAKELRKLEKKKDKQWAIDVKVEFGNKCVICPGTNRLNAHHIIPRQIKELRWEILNGVALCPKHHKYSFIISAHRNPLAFIMWYHKRYVGRYLALSNLIIDSQYNRDFKEEVGEND